MRIHRTRSARSLAGAASDAASRRIGTTGGVVAGVSTLAAFGRAARHEIAASRGAAVRVTTRHRPAPPGPV